VPSEPDGGSRDGLPCPLVQNQAGSHGRPFAPRLPATRACDDVPDRRHAEVSLGELFRDVVDEETALCVGRAREQHPDPLEGR